MGAKVTVSAKIKNKKHYGNATLSRVFLFLFFIMHVLLVQPPLIALARHLDYRIERGQTLDHRIERRPYICVC